MGEATQASVRLGTEYVQAQRVSKPTTGERESNKWLKRVAAGRQTGEQDYEGREAR
jgi:hypothetical protein